MSANFWSMPRNPLVKPVPSLQSVAFLGNYLPRKCGIATFTSDLLGAVAARRPESQCFAVAVNDIKGCYRYPEAVRFEIEEQNLSSYRRAADFLNTRAATPAFDSDYDVDPAASEATCEARRAASGETMAASLSIFGSAAVESAQ